MTSEHNSGTLEAAADAADRLLGFYPTITASDPKLFTTALVQLFASYPAGLVRLALDPIRGLPGKHDFLPSIAIVKKFLDENLEAHKASAYRERMAERERQQKLLERPDDPEMRARVGRMFEELSATLKAGGS